MRATVAVDCSPSLGLRRRALSTVGSFRSCVMRNRYSSMYLVGDRFKGRERYLARVVRARKRLRFYVLWCDSLPPLPRPDCCLCWCEDTLMLKLRVFRVVSFLFRRRSHEYVGIICATCTRYHAPTVARLYDWSFARVRLRLLCLSDNTFNQSVHFPRRGCCAYNGGRGAARVVPVVL